MYACPGRKAMEGKATCSLFIARVVRNRARIQSAFCWARLRPSCQLGQQELKQLLPMFD
jgi:hypothetical protein